MKLVLFDIDGTLITASGAGRRALDRALREVYGTAGPIDSYDFRGGTDPQIIRDLLSLAGVGEPAIAAGEAAVYERYAALLEAEIGDGTRGSGSWWRRFTRAATRWWDS
jgi:beta-phosphoglucomutase-like phosphatase (HAD superfamily)